MCLLSPLFALHWWGPQRPNPRPPVCSLIASTWPNLPSDLICVTVKLLRTLHWSCHALSPLCKAHHLFTGVFLALRRGKVSALVLQVLVTQACGIKLAFCHMYAPVFALHWWGPHKLRLKQRQPCLQYIYLRLSCFQILAASYLSPHCSIAYRRGKRRECGLVWNWKIKNEEGSSLKFKFQVSFLDDCCLPKGSSEKKGEGDKPGLKLIQILSNLSPNWVSATNTGCPRILLDT